MKTWLLIILNLLCLLHVKYKWNKFEFIKEFKIHKFNCQDYFQLVKVYYSLLIENLPLVFKAYLYIHGQFDGNETTIQLEFHLILYLLNKATLICKSTNTQLLKVYHLLLIYFWKPIFEQHSKQYRLLDSNILN